jgi:hypothetical protein
MSVTPCGAALATIMNGLIMFERPSRCGVETHARDLRQLDGRGEPPPRREPKLGLPNRKRPNPVLVTEPTQRSGCSDRSTGVG